jgi:hypothetical protein
MNDTDDADLHQRLCDGDPTAPSQFCDLYLPQLLADRHRWAVPGVRDEHLVEDAAITAVLDFVKRPDAYDRARLAILPYLRMAAKADLLNLLARERRHAIRRAPLDAVELRPVVGNDEREAQSERTDPPAEALVHRLRERLPDPCDREAAALMLGGVRETAAYAVLYGLRDLPIAEQRRIVKQHKDRLDKVMKRLGKRIRDDRP